MESLGAEDKIRSLTGTLKKLVDDMNEKLNKFNQEYSKALIEIQELKKESEKTKTQLKDVKSIEWESRNKNILIFGLKEFKYESKLETLSRVTKLFTEALELNFIDRHIDNLYWVGKKKQNRPLLVRFSNTIMRDHIINKKKFIRKMESQDSGGLQPRNMCNKEEINKIHVGRKKKRKTRHSVTRQDFD